MEAAARHTDPEVARTDERRNRGIVWQSLVR
jgi:hypothetical protein